MRPSLPGSKTQLSLLPPRFHRGALPAARRPQGSRLSGGAASRLRPHHSTPLSRCGRSRAQRGTRGACPRALPQAGRRAGPAAPARCYHRHTHHPGNASALQAPACCAARPPEHGLMGPAPAPPGLFELPEAGNSFSGQQSWLTTALRASRTSLRTSSSRCTPPGPARGRGQPAGTWWSALEGAQPPPAPRRSRPLHVMCQGAAAVPGSAAGASGIADAAMDGRPGPAGGLWAAAAPAGGTAAAAQGGPLQACVCACVCFWRLLRAAGTHELTAACCLSPWCRRPSLLT